MIRENERHSTEVGDVRLFPIGPIVQVPHPVLTQSFSWRVGLRKKTVNATLNAEQELTRNTPSAGMRRGYQKKSEHKDKTENSSTNLIRSRSGLSNTVVVFLIPERL